MLGEQRRKRHRASPTDEVRGAYAWRWRRRGLDSGIVTYDGNGKLRPIRWQAFVVGVQYYLPIAGGKLWLSGNYSRLKSDNIVKLTPIAGQSAVFSEAQYLDANLFVAITPALQLGYSFQFVDQKFGDGVEARNYRNEGGLHFFF